MRKALGILCLVLALLATVNLVRGLASGGSPSGGRRAAYDTGYKAGRFVAPILFGALALCLLRPARTRSTTPPVITSSPGVSRKIWIAAGIGGGLVVLTIAALILVGVVMRLRHSRPGNPIPSAAPVHRWDPRPETVRLEGKTITFTDLHGREYRNITTVRTDGIVLFYQQESGGLGTVFLNSIPYPTLSALGIPTNWPTVSQGRPERALPSASTIGFEQSGTIPEGTEVEARWAEQWKPGRVLQSRGFSVQVQLDDPAFPRPLWMSTNQVRSR